MNEDHRGTILYLHGGGWANGDVEFYSDACMRTALKLERRVIAVDYRRSPEHRFPTALEDCYAVARQLFAGTLIRDADPERIVLMGDSAGGNLTAAVSLLARERGDFRPRTQILLYPLVYNDHSETTLFDSCAITARTTFSPARPSSTTSNCTAHARRFPRSTSRRPSRRRWPTCLHRHHLSTTLCATSEASLRGLDAENEVACFRMNDGVHGYFLYFSEASLVRDTYCLSRTSDGDPLPKPGDRPWLTLLGTD
ncbi:MAG: alpha/beta hydrolase [Coriobacteriaceae bacterium]